MKTQELMIRIAANTADVKKKLEELNANLAKVGSASAGAGSDVRKLTSALGTMGHITGLVYVGKQIYDMGIKLRDAQLDAVRLGNTLKFALGGDSQGAAGMRYIADLANRLGLEFKATADGYAKFAAAATSANLSLAQTNAIFEGVAKATTVMGLSAADAGGVFLALSQMLSKGKVSAEELRGQLGERLPGALAIAARATGVSVEKFSDMLDKGQIIARDFLPRFASEMEKTFGAASGKAAQSAIANVNRLSNAWEQFKQRFGTATDAAGITAPHWLTRALNEANASMDVAIEKGEYLKALMLGIGGFQAGAAGFGVFDKENRREKIIDLQMEQYELEQRIERDRAKGAQFMSQSLASEIRLREARIRAIGQELDALFKMDKLVLPSKDQLKQAAMDTLNSARRTSAAPGGDKDKKDPLTTYLENTTQGRMEAFAKLRDAALKIRDGMQRDEVLSQLVKKYFQPNFDAEAEEERFAQEMRQHLAGTNAEILAQRQEYIDALAEMLRDGGKEVQGLLDGLKLDPSGRREAEDRRYVEALRERLVAIRSAIGDNAATQAMESAISAIERYRSASGQLLDAQEHIGDAMNMRSARLQEIQALVAAGAMTEVDARNATMAAAREALPVVEAHIQQLEQLASQGYPQATRELLKWRSGLVELKGQIASKDMFDGISQGLKDFSGRFNDTFDNARKATERAFNSMTDALTEFVTTGKVSFGDLANSIIHDLIRIQIQENITKPFAGAMSSFDWGSLFGFARGGAPGGVSAWRNQIVDRPTFFAFADGGVMGEAGPEAIMPLRRGPDGRLGVDASKSGANVQVTVINNVPGATATARERNEGGVRMFEVVIEQVENRIASGISRGSGPLSNALATTYGLNRVAGAY